MKREIENAVWLGWMMTAAAVILLTVTVCGCDLKLTDEQKQELTQQVITVLAEKGQARALAYVDQLEADGKLTPEKAEKIKAAIPEGVEKVKSVIEQKVRAAEK